MVSPIQTLMYSTLQTPGARLRQLASQISNADFDARERKSQATAAFVIEESRTADQPGID